MELPAECKEPASAGSGKSHDVRGPAICDCITDVVHPVAMRDLCRALDAHAIVTITDERGVITFVNEKFCAISGYMREELVGKTYRLLNSGHHVRTFFETMWRLISSGRIWTDDICNRARDGSLFWMNTTIVPFLMADRPREYIAIHTDVTLRKNLELRLQQMAYEDALTGLPNRYQLMERMAAVLEECRKGAEYGALLLLDLDEFREINNSFGHHRGDELLKVIARRLTTQIGPFHTVARIGGDEFVVLLTGLGREREAAQRRAALSGEAIISALGIPAWVDGHQLVRSGSIGFVVFDGVPRSATELLQQADVALHQAKRSGHDGLTVCDTQLMEAYSSAAERRKQLQQLVWERQFALFFQSIVDRDRRIVGVEALLRLKHPVHGIVPPAEFIGELEESGDIVAAGEWVLEHVCGLLATWRADPARRGQYVAVNISARHFQSEAFAPCVLNLLARHQLAPGQLKIEITESTLLGNIEETIARMCLLRRHGVEFSVDDFGAGYSSLAYLRRLPLDTIKLDRVFIQDFAGSGADDAIVRAALGLARDLGLLMIAEGVESEEQFRKLRDYGCERYQGFLFGMPSPDLAAVMASGVSAPDAGQSLLPWATP